MRARALGIRADRASLVDAKARRETKCHYSLVFRHEAPEFYRDISEIPAMDVADLIAAFECADLAAPGFYSLECALPLVARSTSLPMLTGGLWNPDRLDDNTGRSLWLRGLGGARHTPAIRANLLGNFS